jgi:hypothetical protein
MLMQAFIAGIFIKDAKKCDSKKGVSLYKIIMIKLNLIPSILKAQPTQLIMLYHQQSSVF